MCYSALVKMDTEYLGKRFGAIAVRKQLDLYAERSVAHPKSFPKLQERIYPGYYAPAIHLEIKDQKAISFMRYGAYPPSHIDSHAAKGLTTYNARRDNLTSSFWSEAFTKHHGFVLIERFYEWVSVRTLLKAGVVTLEQVKMVFAKQTDARKLKILSAGKKYKATPTELKNPLDRQIIIEFRPVDEQEMLAPVIFSKGVAADDTTDLGFAIVTDDPPFEVQNAGHDRCPVILSPDAIESWIRPHQAKPQELLKLLAEKKRAITFTHQLADSDAS